MRWHRGLVTGASGGIGRHFAEQLAQRGVALVLIARSEDVLSEFAATLRGDYGVDVEVVAADLTVADDLQRVADRLADDVSPVDLLINDAGIGTIGPLVDLPAARGERALLLNALAVLRLTRDAGEHMRRRRGGTILNVASLAAYAPVPYFAVYAATKAFVLALSLAVREELRGSGVTVTALCPGFVDTDFADKAGVPDAPARWLWAEPQKIARAGLRGADAGRAAMFPSPAVGAASVMSRLVPPSLFTRLAAASTRSFAEGIVRRAVANVAHAPAGPPPQQDRGESAPGGA